MAASYFPPPESVMNAPPTLPTYSILKGSSHTIPNKYNIDVEKQQDIIKSKFQLLLEKCNPVPFVPSKNLDFPKHKKMLKRLGLWDFAHMKFNTGVRVDLIAELVASYDPKFQCSYVKGTRINVNKADLASAVKLHLKKSEGLELELKEDSMEFIVDFVLNWVLLHGDTWLLPDEVLNWVKLIKEGHPEKLDWAGLLWFMVENELSQGVNLEECFYASHLQCLIKSQCEDVLLEGESKNWERVTNDLHEEIKKRDEKILRLERDLSGNKELVEQYKEALEEMQNVVLECKKMFEVPEEKTETRTECIQGYELSEDGSDKSYEIPEEAICSNKRKFQSKKKFIGIYKTQRGLWGSQINSVKVNTRIWLGTYTEAEVAARAYDAANLYINGSKANLNFPKSYSIAYLPPPNTVMSVETIKRVAAAAALNAKRGQKRRLGDY